MTLLDSYTASPAVCMTFSIALAATAIVERFIVKLAVWTTAGLAGLLIHYDHTESLGSFRPIPSDIAAVLTLAVALAIVWHLLLATLRSAFPQASARFHRSIAANYIASQPRSDGSQTDAIDTGLWVSLYAVILVNAAQIYASDILDGIITAEIAMVALVILLSIPLVRSERRTLRWIARLVLIATLLLMVFSPWSDAQALPPEQLFWLAIAPAWASFYWVAAYNRGCATLARPAAIAMAVTTALIVAASTSLQPVVDIALTRGEMRPFAFWHGGVMIGMFIILGAAGMASLYAFIGGTILDRGMGKLPGWAVAAAVGFLSLIPVLALEAFLQFLEIARIQFPKLLMCGCGTALGFWVSFRPNRLSTRATGQPGLR